MSCDLSAFIRLSMALCTNQGSVSLGIAAISLSTSEHNHCLNVSSINSMPLTNLKLYRAFPFASMFTFPSTHTEALDCVSSSRTI